jgi:hypothetical protein
VARANPTIDVDGVTFPMLDEDEKTVTAKVSFEYLQDA